MSRPMFLFLVVAIIVGMALTTWFTRTATTTFLPGDCPYYAATTQSLVRDGDLELRNQLESGGRTLQEHETFFSVSPDGRIVPKHSTLMPFVAVPFFAVFDDYGFLIFNGCQLAILIIVLARLGGDTAVSRVVALLGLIGTPWLSYIFNFSPDLFGTLFVCTAYLCARERHWARCGVCCAAAVWAKVYLAVVLLPIGWLLITDSRLSLARFVLSSALTLLPMFVVHAKLYGSPLRTGYDCEAHFTTAGELVTAEHFSRFNQPGLQGLGNLLFDARLGLILTAPIWCLWPFGLAFQWKRPTAERRFALSLAMSVILNLLLFAKYDEWNATVHGNRFLFPALALGLPLQVPFWPWFLHRLSTRWPARYFCVPSNSVSRVSAP